MAEKPSLLMLSVLAGVGTALLSPLSVNGIPIVVLVIPFAIITSILYNAESGIVVGVAVSALSALLVGSLNEWDFISYAMAAAVTVLAYDAIYPKQKTDISAVLFVVMGTLIHQFLRELSMRETILFRPEIFTGTSPELGLQIIANVFVMGILLSYWNTPGKK